MSNPKPVTAWTSETAPRNGGRPTMPPEVRAILESKAPEAVKALVALLDDDAAKIRLHAAQAILDRLYGRPAQAVDAQVGMSGGEALLELLRAHSAK